MVQPKATQPQAVATLSAELDRKRGARGSRMSRSAEQIAPTLLPEAPRLTLDAPELPSYATPRTAQPIVRIHILGAMRATTCLGDDVLPRGRKARALLGC